MKTIAFILLALTACGADDTTDDATDDADDISGDGQDADNSNDDTTDADDADGDDDNSAGEPAELAGITRAHNDVRAAVDTNTPLPPLVWNEDLEATARAWASSCTDNEAPSGLIDHNAGRSDGHPYYVGENVYGSSGGATGTDAVESWASEEADFDPATGGCSGVCGHYTQIVWRASVELGCALSNCPGLTYGSSIVCNYGPGGNSGGRPY
jgi:hypothetical protein